MGRTEESWTEDEQFQQPPRRRHQVDRPAWCAGDCQATIASNYTDRAADRAPTSRGQLDQIGEPHGLTVEPDGRGLLHRQGRLPDRADRRLERPERRPRLRHDPPVRPRRPSRSSCSPRWTSWATGAAAASWSRTRRACSASPLDPNFAQNGWVYVYWMPHESIDRDQRIGQRTVSRFTYDAATQTIDQGTRKDLLHWDTQIHSCCHAGGGMAFDERATSTSAPVTTTPPAGRDGYSGNNWTQDYKGISFQDARRTAGNTNDLNGKILRIHPEADGTYTIPDGQPVHRQGGGRRQDPPGDLRDGRAQHRPHADRPGHRLADRRLGRPGRRRPQPGPGARRSTRPPPSSPRRATRAGRTAWATSSPTGTAATPTPTMPTGWYDCDNLKNESPRNTGLVNIPPARDNMIWYSPQGGGPVYPKRTDGSGLPTYVPGEETFTQPYLKGGGQAIMNGPTYQREKVDTDSGVAWPAYWDDKWFIGDESNANNRVAVTVDPAKVERPRPAGLRRGPAPDHPLRQRRQPAPELDGRQVRPGRRAVHARLRRRLLQPAPEPEADPDHLPGWPGDAAAERRDRPGGRAEQPEDDRLLQRPRRRCRLGVELR